MRSARRGRVRAHPSQIILVGGRSENAGIRVSARRTMDAHRLFSFDRTLLVTLAVGCTGFRCVRLSMCYRRRNLGVQDSRGILVLLIFFVRDFDVVEHRQRFPIAPEADDILYQFDTAPPAKPILKIRCSLRHARRALRCRRSG